MTHRVAPLMVLILSLAAPGLAGAAPLAGRWEGVFHGGRGDQAVAFVCRPRGATAFEGALYMDGDEVGPAEHGVVRGDSLGFQVMNFRLLASRSGDQMAFQLIVPNGRTHEFAVHFASADTSAQRGVVEPRVVRSTGPRRQCNPASDTCAGLAHTPTGPPSNT